MLIVPTQPVLSQSFQVTLDGQQVAINLYQLEYGLFADILLSGVFIVTGQISQNGNPLVNSSYLGLQGDFVFYDVTGSGQDPNYLGLNDQFILIFLEPVDLEQLSIQ